MKKTFSFLFTIGFVLSQIPVDACTGISFSTQDGTQLQARTIEWGGFSLESKLVIMPRGQQILLSLRRAKTVFLGKINTEPLVSVW